MKNHRKYPDCSLLCYTKENEIIPIKGNRNILCNSPYFDKLFELTPKKYNEEMLLEYHIVIPKSINSFKECLNILYGEETDMKFTIIDKIHIIETMLFLLFDEQKIKDKYIDTIEYISQYNKDDIVEFLNIVSKSEIMDKYKIGALSIFGYYLNKEKIKVSDGLYYYGPFYHHDSMIEKNKIYLNLTSNIAIYKNFTFQIKRDYYRRRIPDNEFRYKLYISSPDKYRYLKGTIDMIVYSGTDEPCVYKMRSFYNHRDEHNGVFLFPPKNTHVEVSYKYNTDGIRESRYRNMEYYLISKEEENDENDENENEYFFITNELKNFTLVEFLITIVKE